VEKKENTIKIK